MSRLPVRENKKLWDEFCLDIGAGDVYEHLPILVGILQEGKWRTEALNVKKWLRGNLAKRVKRSVGEDDYDLNGKRRNFGPKFDKRSGALIKPVERPFAEFETVNEEGGTLSPEETIDYEIARRKLQTAGGQEVDDDGYVVITPAPADRDTPRILRRKTVAEWLDTGFERILLQRDRPAFDKLLSQTMLAQQVLVARLGWIRMKQRYSLSSRCFTLTSRGLISTSSRRPTETGFAMLGTVARRRKKPEFRKILREEARKRRHGSVTEQLPQRAVSPDKSRTKLGSRGSFWNPRRGHASLAWTD